MLSSACGDRSQNPPGPVALPAGEFARQAGAKLFQHHFDSLLGALSHQSGQPVDPARPIAPIMENFMRNDRGFRRGAVKPKTSL
jgi:hypothetical protein